MIQLKTSNFMREEMDKARHHEFKLFQLQQSSKPSTNNVFGAYDPQQFTWDRVDLVMKHLVVECSNHCTINGTNRPHMYYKNCLGDCCRRYCCYCLCY